MYLEHETYDVAIIGAGPAGSTLSAFLAKAGKKVVLLEQHQFPRHHVGESLIPQVLDILEESGALPLVESAGFLRKEGGTFRWGKYSEPWTFYFDELAGHYGRDYSYQVDRSTFDQILLTHATSLGVKVVYGKVIDFEIGKITFLDKFGLNQVISATFVADCSGQSGFLSSKFGLRTFDGRFPNLAIYTYFDNAFQLNGKGKNNIFCEAVENGWLWYIPLCDTKVSVGFVTHKDNFTDMSFDSIFRKGLSDSKHVNEFTRGATVLDDLRVVSNYSFSTSSLIGDGYLIAGDAGGFIDPVWSTGVYLAVQSAQYAADAIIHGDFSTYNKKMSSLMSVYREFVQFFYGSEVSLESVFWKAHKLLPSVSGPNEAFLKIVSGKVGL